MEPKASENYTRLPSRSLDLVQQYFGRLDARFEHVAVAHLIAEVRHLRQENGELQQRIGHLQYYSHDLALDVHEIYGCDRLTELAEKMRAMAWGETELEDS